MTTLNNVLLLKPLQKLLNKNNEKIRHELKFFFDVTNSALFENQSNYGLENNSINKDWSTDFSLFRFLVSEDKTNVIKLTHTRK